MSKIIDLPSIKNIVLIASGKGGVGKSTVAANIAIGLAQRGIRVGLLDADFHGPSIPVMFGITQTPAVQQRRIQPIERFGISLLSVGMFAGPSKAFVWYGALLKGVLKQLFRDVNWGNLDFLLIDLPPGTGETLAAILSMVKVVGVVVVTTPQDVAQSDVRRSMAMLAALNVPLLALIENMSTYRCSHCGMVEKIFAGNGSAQLALDYSIATHVQLPLRSHVAQCGDSGVPVLATSSPEDDDFSNALLSVADSLVEKLLTVDIEA